MKTNPLSKNRWMCPFTRPFLPFLGYTTCMPLFSRISPDPHPPHLPRPLFLMGNIKLDGIAKLNKKFQSVLDHVISHFEGTYYLIKSYKIQHPILLILLIVVVLHQLSHQQKIPFSITFYIYYLIIWKRFLSWIFHF